MKINSELIFKSFLVFAASTSIFFVILIFFFIGKEALPFFIDVNFLSLFHDRWIPISFKQELYGMLPLISGSLLVTVTASVFLIPLSTISAVYIAFIAKQNEARYLRRFIEVLSGIPPVVLGFFGLIVLIPIFKDVFNLNTGYSAATASFLLVLMAFPSVIAFIEDILSSLPKSMNESSIALGAGRIQTIFKVLLPAAKTGILAASLIGISRVIGETMIVLMVTGNAARISLNPLESVRTLQQQLPLRWDKLLTAQFIIMRCLGSVFFY